MLSGGPFAFQSDIWRLYLSAASLKIWWCLMWGTDSSLFWEKLHMCESPPPPYCGWIGVDFMLRLCPSLSYTLRCGSSLFPSQEEAVWLLVLGSFSEEIVLYVTVDSMCPWEEVRGEVKCHLGLLTAFKIFATVVGMEWYITVVWMCIFWIMNAVGLIFICLLDIWTYFFDERLIFVLFHFSISLVLPLLIYRGSLYVMGCDL